MTAPRFLDGVDPLRVPLDSVRPHPDNPRNGDTAAIIESITANGVYRPIVVQASTRYILAGNHTYAALAEMGSDSVAAVVVDVDDAAAARIMLADNRTADLGRYDEGQLLALLDGMDGDLMGTGYDAKSLDDLRALLDDDAWDNGSGPKPPPSGDDDGFLPRIDLRVSALVFDAWRRMLDSQDGKDDATKLAAYLSATGYLDLG